MQVQSAIETAASAAIPVPTADAPAAAAGTEAQNGTAEKASTEQIPGVGPSEVFILKFDQESGQCLSAMLQKLSAMSDFAL